MKGLFALQVFDVILTKRLTNIDKLVIIKNVT